ncbi:MAG: hypothetical protein PHI11_01675 [Gallionella sp.]|nr:hypothetical protein [Gallionella sp.]
MPVISKRILILIIGAIETIGFILSLVLGVLWAANPSGSYEPFGFVIGLICFAGTDIYRRYEGRLFRTEGVLRTPSERVHHHDLLRQQFKDEIQRCQLENLRQDVIIRHVNRLDDYPNAQNKKGISPWFKVGLLDTYHKGIKVGLGWEGLIKCPHGLRKEDYKADEHGEIKAMLTGEIPYDFIESMNVDGDEYYYLPHIFCHFANKGDPYERLFYTQKVDTGNGHFYWKEIATYEEVKSNSL